jgi:hypothetical protein
MDAHAVREFLARDWDAVADARRDHWAALFNRDPRALWGASQGLLAHVRSLRPDFPTNEDREADLGVHIAVRSQLDAAAHAFTGR